MNYCCYCKVTWWDGHMPTTTYKGCLVGHKMVLFIATQHPSAINIAFSRTLVWNVFRTGFYLWVLQMSVWWFPGRLCWFFRSTNLHMTHSKHQLNRSTKAILSDIIQFEAPVPFPCYHWWNFYFLRHDSSLIALLVCQSHCVLRREWNRFLL